MVLGGGGYTIRNVARTWAFETGQLVDASMRSDLPFTDYYEYYAPDFELDVKPGNMNNANSPEYIEKIKTAVFENLRRTAAAPSVQMHEVPRGDLGTNMTLDEKESCLDDEDADREANKDGRYTQRSWDRKTERNDELSESEDEEASRASGVKAQPGRRKRRDIVNYRVSHTPAEDKGTRLCMENETKGLDRLAQDGNKMGDAD